MENQHKEMLENLLENYSLEELLTEMAIREGVEGNQNEQESDAILKEVEEKIAADNEKRLKLYEKNPRLKEIHIRLEEIEDLRSNLEDEYYELSEEAEEIEKANLS